MERAFTLLQVLLLSTAGCCKKIPQRVRSQPDPDKFFAIPNYFSWIFPLYYALNSHSILVILEG